MQNMIVVLNLSWTNYGNWVSNELVFVDTLKTWSNLLELHGEAVREYTHYSFCPRLSLFLDSVFLFRAEDLCDVDWHMSTTRTHSRTHTHTHTHSHTHTHTNTHTCSAVDWSESEIQLLITAVVMTRAHLGGWYAVISSNLNTCNILVRYCSRSQTRRSQFIHILACRSCGAARHHSGLNWECGLHVNPDAQFELRCWQNYGLNLLWELK